MRIRRRRKGNSSDGFDFWFLESYTSRIQEKERNLRHDEMSILR